MMQYRIRRNNALITDGFDKIDDIVVLKEGQSTFLVEMANGIMVHINPDENPIIFEPIEEIQEKSAEEIIERNYFSYFQEEEPAKQERIKLILDLNKAGWQIVKESEIEDMFKEIMNNVTKELFKGYAESRFEGMRLVIDKEPTHEEIEKLAFNLHIEHKKALKEYYKDGLKGMIMDWNDSMKSGYMAESRYAFEYFAKLDR